jgi:L-ascorbate metabolism protein UlaG (beta-lactamase superfamily)
MRLTKFEQSGFIIETNSGFRFALDIAAYTPLEKLEGINVDAVLVSHLHGDHFSIEHIKKLSPKISYINNECRGTIAEEILPFEIVSPKAGEIITIGDVTVEVFVVNHGPNVSAPVKENFGFILKADGQSVYFAGDMFYPSGIDVSVLEVDYALIPVGTFYTFGPAEAFAFAQQFKKIGKIISMHYEKDPETKDQFITLAKEHFNVE